MTQPPWNSPDSLALAGVLHRWVSALPRWDPESPEAWVPFLCRYNEAEADLSRRIRRLPSCELNETSQGRHMHLTLAGVSVRSGAGVPGTCRVWIAAARARKRP